MPDGQDWGALRDQIIGLGGASARKSYYPELQRRLSELEQARAQLEESEAYLRAILDTVSEAVFIQDADTGAIIDVNEGMCRMYGWTREEACALEVDALSAGRPPYTQDEAMAWLRRARDDGPQRFEWQARARDGRLFWVEVGLSLTTLRGRKCAVVTVTDVDDQRRAEADRLSLQEQLQRAQRLESIGRLAGGVAHDHNNMLSVIVGSVEYVLAHLPDGSPLRPDLVEALGAAQRSAELTRQLLAFARKQTIVPQVLDLNAAVESLRRFIAKLVGEHITVDWRPGSLTGSVRLDPSQLNQLLTNLCVNARDAMPHGGRLTVETSELAVGEGGCVECPGLDPGRYIVLTVADNGCGIAEADLPHLFEPFYTTKPIGEGTGLGLATVYGIVRQNGGCITAASAPGQGATFRVLLPCHDLLGAPPAARGGEMDVLNGGHETILLVEDEPAIMRLTERLLRGLGYRVHAVGSPEAAIAVAQQQAGQLDLLLTDMLMPGMSGRDLARYLRGRQPAMRCLFISGYAADSTVGQGEIADGYFLAKPFDRASLAAAVRAALNSAR